MDAATVEKFVIEAGPAGVAADAVEKAFAGVSRSKDKGSNPLSLFFLSNALNTIQYLTSITNAPHSIHLWTSNSLVLPSKSAAKYYGYHNSTYHRQTG